jgi:hypothetical protein
MKKEDIIATIAFIIMIAGAVLLYYLLREVGLD